MNTSSCVLLSFPRSGSHYLQELLYVRFRMIAKRCRTLSEEDSGEYAIGIVRNPIDSIASLMALQKNNSVSQKDNAWTLKTNWTQDFIDSMLEIAKNADIIIDFDELVNHPNVIAQKISSITGHKLLDLDVPIVVKDEPDSLFKPTSKGLQQYEEMYSLTKSHDLSKAIEAYEMVLAKAI